MALDSLSARELGQAAYAEAAAFNLDPNWKAGREPRSGFAIDDAHSSDIDDAVSLSTLDGSDMLHVSIADVGTLANQPAIHRYAQRRVRSLYIGHRAVAPMIPPAVSEDKLSLLGGVERPVVTVHVPIGTRGNIGPAKVTRGVICARRISYGKIEDLLEKESHEAVALRGLERVARVLFAARHGGEIDPEDAALEDEENNLLESKQGNGAGRLIVQESMIAANAAMAHYMRRHGIPALYHNSGYIHFTSPLRRFPDFVNHANLAAFLEGREYPYPTDSLGRIAVRLQSLATKKAVSKAAPSARRETSYLLKKFTDGSAGPGELATALFNAVGTAAEVEAAKSTAAQFAANHIHHARPALLVAIARGLAVLRPVRPTDDLPGTKIVLEDGAGNIYPYPRGRNPLKMSVAFAELIGQICGVHVQPVIPESRTREGRILRGSIVYLRKLADEGRLSLTVQILQEADGRVYAGVLVNIGGKRHTAAATMPSKRQALRDAGAQLIKSLDLINNPPPIQPSIIRATERRPKINDPKQNPIEILQARQQTAGGLQAVYTFAEPYGHNNETYVCTCSLTDADGNSYEATATGKGKMDAKRQAAAALLAQLPKQPLNKKGKMY